jgi:N-acetylmuramoyl-L-alanine amidase-like protein
MAEIDEVTVYGSNKWSKLKPIDLSKIEPVDFPEEQYHPYSYEKKQIVLHHTVSGPGVRGDINTWLGDTKRIGTCIIVDYKGVPYQMFSSRFWAHHIGVKSTLLKERGFSDWSSRNVKLNKESISIEIDSWGWLEKVGDNRYKTYYGNTITLADDKVIHYPEGYRGKYYFEKYTDEALKTVGELLLFWSKRYNIPLDFKGMEMFDINDKAIGGEPGVWCHTSYRPWPNDKHKKWDLHPQPELISMLRTIGNLV